MARDWKGIIFRGCMVVQFCRSEHTGTQLVQHRVLSWIIGEEIYLKLFWAPEMPFSICSVSDIIGFFGIQHEQSWRYRNRIAWWITYKRHTFLTHHVEANVIVLSNSRNILFQTSQNACFGNSFSLKPFLTSIFYSSVGLPSNIRMGRW